MAETKNLGAIARKSRLMEMPDGRTVELKQLTLADIAIIEEEAAQAVKRDLLLMYSRNLDVLPEDQRQAKLDEIFARAEAIRPETITDEQILNFCQSVRGTLTTVWLAMRAAVPGLTYDRAAEMFAGHQEHLRAAARQVNDLTKGTLGNADAAPSQPP